MGYRRTTKLTSAGQALINREMEEEKNSKMTLKAEPELENGNVSCNCKEIWFGRENIRRSHRVDFGIMFKCPPGFLYVFNIILLS